MSASRQDEMENPENPTQAPEADPAEAGAAEAGAAEPEVMGGVSLIEEDPRVQRLQADVDALSTRLADTEARLRQVSNAYRQKTEEIDSIKDRLGRQAAVQEEIRRGEVVESLFEPVENLQRSVESVKGTPAEDGLRIVLAQFMAALRKLGLEEVPGVGSRFDPNVHEAIATAPVPTQDADNTVVSVYSTGFRIGSRLIRPARVIIGAYADA